jgi:pyruvate, water dikinase
MQEAKRYLASGPGSKNSVRGMPVTDGRITGIAKVCNGSVEALKKIETGDILITGMTMPDCVPAMRRAAAIVTDEGGITCHAAIIARELKKPCIVGTKHATQVFKDGDRVEVDTNKGVVRKL